MTRVFFIRKDKRAKVEHTNKTYKLWEESDGYHSFSADAIFSHKEGLHDKILIFFEDIVAPVGSSRSLENVNSIAAITDMIKDAGGKQSVSKMFSRFMDSIMKYGLWIFVMMMILFAVIYSFTTGGVHV